MKRAWYAAIVVAVVALVAAVVALTAGSDDDETASGGSTTTTTGPRTTTTSGSATTTTSEPVVDQSEAVVMWPLRGSSTTFDDPVEAARSFAIELLEFEAPAVGLYRQGDSRSGEVEIRPRANGPATTVIVRQLGPDDSWSVLGSTTENIEVTRPTAGELITSPVAVAGRAVAFEGHVDVDVVQDEPDGVLGTGFVTGGGDEMRAFDGRVPFETAGTRYGTLLFRTRSAENGQVWEAVALRVAFRSTDADAAACGSFRSTRPQLRDGQMEVKAYAICDVATGDTAIHPVYRAVDASPGVLKASLEALLAGLTSAERSGQLSSWFSEETADMLRNVTITDGHAIVDLDDLRQVIPNASSSAGSERLLAQLDATVFQFRSVESVEYRIEGDCEAFNEWLQFGGCDRRTRPASSD